MTYLKRTVCRILLCLFQLLLVSTLLGEDQEAKTSGTISFVGYIDGTDHLHFKGKNMWYVHGAWQLPGKHNDDGGEENSGNKPTTVNGDTWYPSWPDNSTSSNYERLDPPLPTCGSITVSLSDVQCDSEHGGSIYIEQQPDSENENEVVVFLDDDTPIGPHWLSFTLVWTSQCSSSCSAGAGSSSSASSSENGTEGSAGISLGNGQLTLPATSPNSSLATPAGLAAMVGTDSNVIRGAGNAVRQIADPKIVADIQTINSQKYTVRLYYRNQASADTDSSGVYTFIGTPYAVWTVENPGDINDPLTTLRITQQEGSLSRVTEFFWPDGNNDTLVLSTGNGLRRETRAVSYEPDKVSYKSGTGNRTEMRTIESASGTLVYKEINTFHKYPWGEEMIQKIVDPSNAALASQWSYGVNNTTTGYAHLVQMVQPSGYWERYEYDSFGRQTKVVAQYLDAPVGSSEDLSRVTAIVYETADTTSSGGDGGTKTTKTTVDTLLGIEVSRNYLVNDISRFHGAIVTNVTYDKQCQAGADVDDPTNLVTTRKKKTGWEKINNSRVFIGGFSGYTESIKMPDGTISLYSYSSDATTKTTTVRTGQPNDDDSVVVDGTETVTVSDMDGHVLSQTTSDIVSGLILSSSETRDADVFGRPTVVVQLSGTTLSSYGCCGLESQTDQEGISTAYVYDSLQRVIASTRAGVTNLTTYDARGSVLATSRTATGSPTILTGTSAYDLAGRKTSFRDALGNTTIYSEAIDGSGDTLKTTTYPDGSTRVETYFRDGQIKEISGTAIHPRKYEYGVDTDGQWTKEIRVGIGGSSTEWTKSWNDAMGRSKKTLSSGGAASYSYYNAQGRLSKQVDADGVATLYQYNAKGELEYTAIDMNRDGVIDTAGPDRVTRVQKEVATAHGTTVGRTTHTAYGTPSTVSMSENSVNGRQSWNTSNNLVSSSVTAYDGLGGRTVTLSAPDGTVTTQLYQNGLLLSSTLQNPSVGTLSSATLTYDAYGRPSSSTDARGVVTTWSYDNGDRVTSTTVTSGEISQTTSSILNFKGQPTQTTRPEGTVDYAYRPTGEITDMSGAQTYPIHYGYDTQGRLKKLTTWQDFAGKTGAAVTTWNYDSASGFLTSKIYNGGEGTTYTYTAAGRLASRTWARGITTNYGYDNGGTNTSTQYSDTTPAVGLTLDQQGRSVLVAQGANSVSMAWNNAGQLASESWSGGPLGGLAVTGSYDSFQRLSEIDCPAIGYQSVFTYDAASRLSSVTNGSSGVQYGYLANSSLLLTSTFQKQGAPVMTTTRGYDGLSRLTGIHSSVAGSVRAGHAYSYNTANQRTGATLADGSSWIYQYDSLGQVISGKKYFADGTEVGGEQFGYAFDNIGNRTSSNVNSRSAAYTVNSLNQYSQREVPGAVDILGTTATNAVMVVNDQKVSRHGEYFYKTLEVPNTSAAAYQSVKVVAAKPGGGPNGTDVVTQQSGHRFVAKTPEPFTYDTDGNLTSDGRWSYSWDGENRLIALETIASAVAAGVPKEKLEYAYDWQGRRIQKKVSMWNVATNSYQLSAQTKFVYQGWNLIAELNGSNAAVRTYAWGKDLSGSMQGAGGVGGLVLISDAASGGSYAPAYDGNGNVTALVSMDSGAVAATYEYGPFGEPLRVSGAMAGQNPFRFSTKYTDDETGLLYYGYRYYNPTTGRWISRDPIDEDGGVNLYGFAKNAPQCNIDILGLLIGDCVIDKGEAQTQEDKDWIVSVKKYANGKYGVTGGGWKVNANNKGPEGKKFQLVFSGDMTVKARWFIGSPDYVVTHETTHTTIAQNAWNTLRDELNQYDGGYCSNSCMILAKTYANAFAKYTLAKMEVDQANHDASPTPTETNNMNERKTAMDNALKAWNDSNCQKPTSK